MPSREMNSMVASVVSGPELNSEPGVSPLRVGVSPGNSRSVTLVPSPVRGTKVISGSLLRNSKISSVSG